MLEGRLAEASRESELLKAKEADLTQSIGSVDRAPEERLESLSQELDRFRRELRTKEGELREARERSVSDRSRLSTLEEQLVAASPVRQLRKTLGEKRAAVLAPYQATLFVEGLTVPKESFISIFTIL